MEAKSKSYFIVDDNLSIRLCGWVAPVQQSVVVADLDFKAIRLALRAARVAAKLEEKDLKAKGVCSLPNVYKIENIVSHPDQQPTLPVIVRWLHHTSGERISSFLSRFDGSMDEAIPDADRSEIITRDSSSVDESGVTLPAPQHREPLSHGPVNIASDDPLVSAATSRDPEARRLLARLLFELIDLIDPPDLSSEAGQADRKTPRPR